MFNDQFNGKVQQDFFKAKLSLFLGCQVTATDFSLDRA